MPATNSKRSTVYFEARLHRALRLKAAETDRTISDVVNEAVRTLLAEDANDLAALRDRADEPAEAFDVFVQQLRADGAI